MDALRPVHSCVLRCVLYWSRAAMFVFCIGHVLECLCSVLVTCWNVCGLFCIFVHAGHVLHNVFFTRFNVAIDLN